jgi:predicted transcriptional regulator
MRTIMAENNSEGAPNFIELAGDITIAWLQNPNVNPAAEDVPAFLKSMHRRLRAWTKRPSRACAKSLHMNRRYRCVPRSRPDHLVSLIDGRKYKTLKRHLAANGLTPDEYRARYGLKADYPMVAASFAAMRREIAEKIGLGRKSAARPDDADGTVVVPAEAQEAVPAAAKRCRYGRFEREGRALPPRQRARTDKPPAAASKASPPPAGRTCRRRRLPSRRLSRRNPRQRQRANPRVSRKVRQGHRPSMRLCPPNR